MVLPVLSPDPNTNDKVIFGKGIFYFGGNRGRGQVYPEGNQSNNNQFFASATGTIKASGYPMVDLRSLRRGHKFA